MFLELLFLSLLIQAILFLPAYFKQTDKLTDFSYSLTFIILAIFAFSQSIKSVGHYLLLTMIILWSLRLGVYLIIRIKKIKRDKRFDGMREKFFSFAGFWLLQGISVWVIMLSSLFYFFDVAYFSLLSIIGLIVWLFGLVTETIADLQKYRFINDVANQGKWIDIGLWKYSRHPNYFGEICVWLGVYLFVLPSLFWPAYLIAILSPLFILILLLFVSGIPKLEKYADDKWGDNLDYQAYKKSTSKLILWFKKKL